MKKILVLGCGGFIGRNLAFYFSKKKKYSALWNLFKQKTEY